jgi:hypothetical protein
MFRRGTRFLFAIVQNYHFGDDPLVLVGVGDKGKDLEFAATKAWLDANNAEKRFGLTYNDKEDIGNHLKTCSSLDCAEGRRRYEMVLPYITGKKIFGSESLIQASQFHKKDGRTGLRITGRPDSIEISSLIPFFKLFEKDKDLWLWPKQTIKNPNFYELMLSGESSQFSKEISSTN